MEKFFYPRSMVVFGVSTTKMNLGQIVLLNNSESGYEGKLYGVGSKEGEVNGVRVYKAIENLPETPEVAIFLTPAKTIPPLMEKCGLMGIRHIVIESGGFSEFSHGDNSLEEAVLKIAEKYSMKVIGPNCIGTINYDIKMMMPFGLFKNPPPPGGKVALIVQSGGVGGTFLRAFAGYGINPGKFVSIGNKLQLDEAHFLEYFLNDDKTEIITAYLEGFKRGREFYSLAIKSEKPIIVQKANRSEVSAKIAQSHTTALSGSDEVVDAAFHQAAVIRVEDELDLINAVKIIRLPLMKGRRVAVLSRSGGHAVLSADACAKYGFEMLPFPPSFIKKLKTIYHTRVIAHQNPLDLGEVFDYTIFIDILEEVLKLETFDAVLFNHLYIAEYEGEMSRTFLAGVEKLVAKHKKPVSLAMISEREEILNVSKNFAFPVFTSPLEAATALNISATYSEQKEARNHRGTTPVYDIDQTAIKNIRELCLLQKRIPLTSEALEVCAAAGLPPVKGQAFPDEKSIGQIKCRYPVALKLLSRSASHKSDIGGVKTNIHTEKELSTSILEMRKSIEKMNAGIAVDGFLVQEMAPEGIECFVGGRRDPIFGPIIMAGLGGIYIEIFKDAALRLAPVTKSEAQEMLTKLKMYPLLQGARGKKRVDMDAFVDIICRVSYLMTTEHSISEMDLNPVIVHPQGQGVSIIDARVFF